MEFTIITAIYALFFIAHQCWETYLNRLDKNWIQTHSDTIPEIYRDVVDADTFRKSIRYNLEGKDFGMVHRFFDVPLHWFFIIWGFGFIDTWVRMFDLNPYFSGLLFMGAYGLIGLILELPFSIYDDFVLENRYGFNRKTPGLFVSDLFKSILVNILLGGPLLFCVLYLMDRTGPFWWIWTWLFILGFQVFILWAYPVLIAPLFNKFKPLEGELADRIKSMADRIGFRTSGIMTMDGSKRSSHSNAFFTGIGKSKRIVFFDTLLDRISEEEVLGVLAHEMGHFKLGHTRKRMVSMLVGLLFFLGLLAYLKNMPVFYHSFGFANASDYAALIVFSLLFSQVIFPVRFLFTHISRKHEFQADGFAAEVVGSPEPLIGALKTLHTENLASPVVHPRYAAYHYSHPDLPERVDALRKNVID